MLVETVVVWIVVDALHAVAVEQVVLVIVDTVELGVAPE